MADGIKKLRKVQAGKETTAGTSVAATALMRIAGATIEDARETEFPEEDVGLLVNTDRNYQPFVLAKMAWPDNPATYEQLPYVFEAGIKKVTNGATDTGGSGKIYAYPFPTSSPNITQTFTLEGGDNIQEEEMEYSFVQGFKMSGAPKEAIQFSADWVGRQVTPSSFTGAIAIPTVEEILFQNTKLYIDNAGGLGGTLVSSTLLGFELDIDTGLREVFTGDGNLYFDRTKNIGPTGTLKITFEHNASAVAEKAAWRAKTSRSIRLKVEGSTLQTAGAGYSKKTLIIDVCGRWEVFDKIDEMDGNDIVAGTLQIGYNSTEALWGEITVVNTQASIT